MTRTAHRLVLAGFLALALGASPHAQPAAAPYFPDRGVWQTRAPDRVGMDSARLAEAVQYAVANENPSTKDLALDIALSFGREPYDAIIGPTQPRGALSGMVIRRGYVVAEWGPTDRVDMTFSVTKTFLSTIVGLAWQQGSIKDVQARLRDDPRMPRLFDSEHNAAITWDHLLRQTSDWQGTLWGKPDWADRPEGDKPADWPNRKMSAPGTRYKYNDVRVNVLALCALHVWQRPLPDVLREQVMGPIGASDTWRWHGYESSWADVAGTRLQSVTGGGHWGGGMFINAQDLARFGYLFLRNGRWGDREIVSEKWIAMARSPGPANADYGHMNWFLNTGRKPLPSAPETSVTFRGNGQNIVYIDWDNDLVVVVRWIRGGAALDTFLGKVLASIVRAG